MDLTCILQFTDPVGLLLLEAGYLSLDLDPLLIFFVDASDQIEPLLLLLEGLFLGAKFLLLFLLATNHVLHGLGLEFV